MRLNTWVTLGASVAFGALAVFLARSWINDAIEGEFRQAAPVGLATERQAHVPVIIANVEVPFGTELSADLLRVAEFPEDAVPAGSFRSLDSLFTDPSMKTVSLSHIVMNEAIIDTRISGPGGRGSLSAIISEGMRAVSVRVDAVAGVAGFIVPGDYVDVAYIRDEETRRNGNNLISDIILQNVKVLGIDQNLNNQSTEPDVANTVTLEVRNEEAQKLQLAMDAGKLSLTLRRAGETTIEPSKTVDQKLIVGAGKTQPRSPVRRANVRPVVRSAATVSGVADVTIIRGDERDEVQVIREDIKTSANSELAGG